MPHRPYAVRGMKKTVALLLAVTLLFGGWFGIAGGSESAYGAVPADTVNVAQASLAKAIGYYSAQKEKPWNLGDWEEVLAVYGAAKIPALGVVLEQWELSANPTVDATGAKSYLPVIVTGLIKGLDCQTEFAELLGKAGEGSRFSNHADVQAYCMLAARIGRQSGLTVPEGSAYDPLQAAKYLASLQNAAGGFTGEWDGGLYTVDTTAGAILALAPEMADASVQAAVEKAVAFLKEKQKENGSFYYEYSEGAFESVNSTAVAVWALAAAKAAAAGDAALIDQAEGVMVKAVPALTKWQNPDGSFYSNPEQAGTFNQFASKQAMIALYDVASGTNLFEQIGRTDRELLTTEVRVISDQHPDMQVKISARKGEPLAEAAQIAWTKAGGSGDIVASEYDFRLDGTATEATEVLSAIPEGQALHILRLAAKTVQTEAVFEKNLLTGQLNQPQTVKLLRANTEEPLANVVITIDGSPAGYQSTAPWGPLATGADGCLTIAADKLLDARDYIISTETSGVSRPVCRIQVGKGEQATKTVGVRIEGIDRNILFLPAVTVTTDGTKALTALDAVRKALTDKNVPSDITDSGWIQSIAGTPNKYFGQTGAAYDYWNFHYNGGYSNYGLGNCAIENGDQILLFYGNADTQMPKATFSYLAAAKELRVTIRTAYYDETAGALKERPVLGAKVTLTSATGKKQTVQTNAEGVAAYAGVSAGKYGLQVEQYNLTITKEGKYLPTLVRLEPNYSIALRDGAVVGRDQVTLKVVGYDGTSATVMLGTKVLDMSAGDTAFSILTKAGLTTTGTAGYVAGINGLKEKAYGPYSGWKYSVNGVYPSVGAAGYTLKAGDAVVWIYVLNANAEPNANEPGALPAIIPSLTAEKLRFDPAFATVAAQRFGDVSSSSWYAPAVGYLSSRSVLSGRANGIFAPTEPITRAEFVAILARIAEAGTSAAPSRFSDVSVGAWYASSVAWATEKGFISGYPTESGTVVFRPDRPISREELAAILDRFHRTVGGGAWQELKKPLSFTDEGQIGHYARTAVAELQKAGLINGIPTTGQTLSNSGDYRFEPAATATRAQGAQILGLYLQAYRPSAPSAPAEGSR